MTTVKDTIAQKCLCVWILILCASAAGFAQAGRVSVSGLITDPTGAVISGAHVTLLNPSTGVEQHSVTHSGGLYNFVSLNPGVYKATAQWSLTQMDHGTNSSALTMVRDARWHPGAWLSPRRF